MAENNDQELLPCPFCGSKAKVHGSNTGPLITGWFVNCDGCGVSGMPSSDADGGVSVVNAWNRRASMLKAAPEAIAWATMNEEGEPAMLFFDKQEAMSYCAEGEEPWALGFVDGGLVAPEVEGWISVKDRLPPDREMVAVGWMDVEDHDHADRYSIDYMEEGVWQFYFNEHEHYLIAGVAHGNSEDAPYTHWQRIGPVPASTKDSSGVGTGGKHADQA